MRALRVGKLTIAALSAACRGYLRDDQLTAVNPTFTLLERSREDLESLAASLYGKFKSLGIDAQVVESSGRCGGGTLPDLEIDSVAVEVLPRDRYKNKTTTFAERLYRRLLQVDPPVLAVLREGRILFDVLTLWPNNITDVADAVSKSVDAEAEV